MTRKQLALRRIAAEWNGAGEKCSSCNRFPQEGHWHDCEKSGWRTAARLEREASKLRLDLAIPVDVWDGDRWSFGHEPAAKTKRKET